MSIAAGARLGPYEIVAPLGAGGMGEVYRARDPRLKRDIALKVLSGSTAADLERRARFEIEAQSIAALSHPNIITIYSVEEADDVLFLTMEYVEGKPLSDLIVKGGLPLTQIFNLAIPLADAVSAAHQRGITHRDLKPANVMVTADGRPKVLDFGLAKLANVSPVDDGMSGLATAALTGEGRIVGTVAYMSPEQAQGKPIDHRTDIFSLGVMLYELATGERPFQGDTSISVLSSIIKDSPQSVVALRPTLPHDLSRIIHRCLLKDADHRYQMAKDVRNELEDLKRDTDVRLQTSDDLGGALKRATESAAIPVVAGPAPQRRTRWRAAATAATVVGVGAIVAFVYLSRPRAFLERDSVVIADFANTTGEPVFDDTLKEALEVELRQSPFIGVLPEQRVQGTLRLMGRRPGDKLTPNVARDLCQRTASKAVIGGTISQLGRSYVITIDASNCRTGDTIEKQQTQAADKDDVLKSLGVLAERLRRGLGESLASIEKYDAPIHDATTGSLDALKSYSLGVVTRRQQGDAASLPFFRKAIEQDPDFALAHARLGTIYGNLNESALSTSHIIEAYRLRDRVSEPERLYITAGYYTGVEHSLPKTVDTYQIWVRTYPNDFVPHVNLANAYRQLGEYEKAADELRAAIALAPDQSLPYGSLASDYVTLRRLDDARRTLDEALKRGVDSVGVRNMLYLLAYLRQDEQEMTRQVDAARRFPDGFGMLNTRAILALYGGQLALAKELATQFTTETISKTGLKGAAARLWSNVAEAAGEFGVASDAHAIARKALDLDRGSGTLVNSLLALLTAGDLTGARKMADELRQSPDALEVDVQNVVKVVDAFVRLGSGDRAGIEALPAPRNDGDLGVLFAHGLANFSLGNWEAAAGRFSQVVDGATFEPAPFVPLSRLYYARALARLGKPDDSRKAYAQFFEVWKRADPDLPVLLAARREYQELVRVSASTS